MDYMDTPDRLDRFNPYLLPEIRPPELPDNLRYTEQMAMSDPMYAWTRSSMMADPQGYTDQRLAEYAQQIAALEQAIQQRDAMDRQWTDAQNPAMVAEQRARGTLNVPSMRQGVSSITPMDSMDNIPWVPDRQSPPGRWGLPDEIPPTLPSYSPMPGPQVPSPFPGQWGDPTIQQGDYNGPWYGRPPVGFPDPRRLLPKGVPYQFPVQEGGPLQPSASPTPGAEVMRRKKAKKNVPETG